MEYENIIQQVDLRFWSQLRCKRTTRSISDRFAPQGRKKMFSGVKAPQMKASYSGVKAPYRYTGEKKFFHIS